ncbi:hypothetical protein PHYBLDRAFT_139012 [Phycomyces blakesleeanus NRRL 1555(-)]|uniref:Uncharacterized protein n=1 Tax=Phycomyces blakesleeanus (strain ATCC 8743b / DSM 1359 / FGSC 10004 / NBRC 33097 / NRRL 1555) TaxID=763407 RepID=A0A163ETG1_PHYB8|nr:hypothetical protein PHYBLDRAFT_139012 [Phycomyces blakesleeanus NRRL 1555(-)]OAD81460.1 hypothetical protein PHYBLDRAFT_139012 [Phycomyces blakesleeanus NRRL 1555(-)]|eukprot:XP_018299500.1 hypothetical protein PHYBLDRAFT_139012 [Phycomyces blakesleeanus NRRL 1555(-)]
MYAEQVLAELWVLALAVNHRLHIFESGGSDPLVLKKFLVGRNVFVFHPQDYDRVLGLFFLDVLDIRNPCIWTLFVSVADCFLQAFDCRVFEICLPVFLATVCSNLAAVYPDFALDYNISGLHLSAVLSVALSVVPVAVLVVVLVVVLKNMTTAYIWALPWVWVLTLLTHARILSYGAGRLSFLVVIHPTCSKLVKLDFLEKYYSISWSAFGFYPVDQAESIDRFLKV